MPVGSAEGASPLLSSFSIPCWMKVVTDLDAIDCSVTVWVSSGTVLNPGLFKNTKCLHK